MVDRWNVEEHEAVTRISDAGDSFHSNVDFNRPIEQLQTHGDTSLAHVVIVLVFTYLQGGEWQREGVEVSGQIGTELIELRRTAWVRRDSLHHQADIGRPIRCITNDRG